MKSEANPETSNVQKSLTYDTDATCGTSTGDLVKRSDPMGNVTYTHTGATYYHLSSSYWPNGLVNALSSNISALPTLTYTPDGEGRVLKLSAATGQNPVTATTYNTRSQATDVTLGSTGTQTFGFDPNSGRPTSYSFHMDGLTETGTITHNTNGTISQLAIVDPFTAADTQTCIHLRRPEPVDQRQLRNQARRIVQLRCVRQHQ